MAGPLPLAEARRGSLEAWREMNSVLSDNPSEFQLQKVWIVVLHYLKSADIPSSNILTSFPLTDTIWASYHSLSTGLSSLLPTDSWKDKGRTPGSPFFLATNILDNWETLWRWLYLFSSAVLLPNPLRFDEIRDFHGLLTVIFGQVSDVMAAVD
jgi:hypothetical protein